MWASPGNWFRGSSIRVIAHWLAFEPNLEAFVGVSDLPLHPRTTDRWDDAVVADEVAEHAGSSHWGGSFLSSRKITELM